MKIRLHKNNPLVIYLSLSVSATFLDVATTYLMFFLLNGQTLILINTTGVMVGAFFHYIYSSKYVFQVNLNFNSFIIFFSTFLVGVLLANIIIIFCYEQLNLSFAFSKMLSIVIPFFVMYYLRTTLNKKVLASGGRL